MSADAVFCSCHDVVGETVRSVLTCSDPRGYACMRAREFGIKATRLLSSERSKGLVAIRTRVAAELRAFGCSLPEIGRALNRHHTTILYLLKGEAV